MDKAIREFAKQFGWKPEIINAERLPQHERVTVGGMGGSHLAADLYPALGGSRSASVHRDYGLPRHADPEDTLLVASSYSGNTEETVDFAKSGIERGFAAAAISTGGRLIDFARANDLPHIILPNAGIQPRSALGFSILALAEMLGDGALLDDLHALESKLDPASFEAQGKELAQKLSGFVPVIYASEKNASIAYNWKIKMNETGKIPAFSNAFPELNHNEMTGYDFTPQSKPLSEKFAFIFISDESDHPQVRKRFKVTRSMYEKKGLAVHDIPLRHGTRAESVFSSLLLADWTAFHSAASYGAESEQVPMVEAFKKMLA